MISASNDIPKELWPELELEAVSHATYTDDRGTAPR